MTQTKTGDRMRCDIYIGMEKTGTTSIQTFLSTNRKLLATAKSSRRFRLELEVIDENLRDSLDAYERGMINRTGVPLPSNRHE